MLERLKAIADAYETYFGNRDAPRLVVEAGSRDGHDAAALVEALGFYAQGIAIEAREEAVGAIRAAHPNLVAIHAAVLDYDGYTGFATLESDDPDIQGSSSFRAERAELFGVPVRLDMVPCARLDTLLEASEKAFPFIDILKVDVEGFTPEALAGLGLRLTDVLVAHLETETFHREEAPWLERATNVAVAAVMRKAGFILVETGYEWGPSIEDQLWVNTSYTSIPKGFVEPAILEKPRKKGKR